MTIPGVPVIYFGDEIGEPGGNDPDNRRMLRFDGLNEQEKWVKQNVKELTTLRSARIELIYGSYEPLLVDKNTFAFVRTYFDKMSLVVFNNSSEEKQIEVELPKRFSADTLQSNFGRELENAGGAVRIRLPAHSFDIITN